MLLFVDDGLLVSKSRESIDKIIKALKQTFEVTLGDASLFVGLHIERNRKARTMFIHQTQYTQRLIEKFNMSNAKPVCIPADPNANLSSSDTNDTSIIVPFREAVGSLTFLAQATRPDISFAVNQVSRH